MRVGINTGPVVVGEVGLGAQAGVHGDGRRGERRRAHGADGRARHRADHRGHVPARRRPVRGRAARRRGAQGEAQAGARPTGCSAASTRRGPFARPGGSTRRSSDARPRWRSSAPRSRVRSTVAGRSCCSSRRPRARQEPADRGGQRDLGGAGAGRRPPMGLLAVRPVRHDAAVRAVPAADPRARRRQGDGSRRDGTGEDRRADGGGRPGGVGERSERVARALLGVELPDEPPLEGEEFQRRRPSSSSDRPSRRVDAA